MILKTVANTYTFVIPSAASFEKQQLARASSARPGSSTFIYNTSSCSHGTRHDQMPCAASVFSNKASCTAQPGLS